MRAAAIAAELIGCERVRVFHDHLIVKPPHGGGTIPWHRDLPNWPVAEPRAVSCWLALDDVTAESGAMRFMVGGHEAPMTPPSTSSTSRSVGVSVRPTRWLFLSPRGRPSSTTACRGTRARPTPPRAGAAPTSPSTSTRPAPSTPRGPGGTRCRST
ncbi:MAG: phytanoyl-CoA dioxygenase family protein [Sandaracinaceae bacterium]|nr:phytanoyl-CoA dioxygenase family protein [Sandaracinaceae bacterium]